VKFSFAIRICPHSSEQLRIPKFSLFALFFIKTILSQNGCFYIDYPLRPLEGEGEKNIKLILILELFNREFEY